MLTLTCASYADVVIGDFEQSMEGWGPTWETPAPTLSYSTIGATLGQNSLCITPGKAGWQWMIMYSGLVDTTIYKQISVDVTWVAAEWGATPWCNFKEMAVNSDGPSGWKQYTPADPCNPDWPGSWDPANWGDQTRTLTWDISGYDATGATWMQIVFSQNFGGNEVGNFYIDNAKLIGEEPAPAGPVHSYTFEDGTANDSVGDANGVLMGDAYVDGGALVTVDQDDWMEMPGDVIAMNTYSEITIEAWYTPEAGANTSWSMLAYFGDSVNGLGSNGYFITSARGDNKSRAAISCGDIATPWASESGADGLEYDDGLLHHMVSTLSATDITLYIDGVLIASTPLSATNSISCISPNFAYLAKGGYDGDPEWIGLIHEFNIYNRALSESEVMYLAGNRAEPIMLDVENFSFELPGTGKQKCWNGKI